MSDWRKSLFIVNPGSLIEAFDNEPSLVLIYRAVQVVLYFVNPEVRKWLRCFWSLDKLSLAILLMWLQFILHCSVPFLSIIRFNRLIKRLWFRAEPCKVSLIPVWLAKFFFLSWFGISCWSFPFLSGNLNSDFLLSVTSTCHCPSGESINSSSCWIAFITTAWGDRMIIHEKTIKLWCTCICFFFLFSRCCIR